MSDLEEFGDPLTRRRAELIAGAVRGELSAVERAELDRMRAADASIDGEIDEVRALTERISAMGVWQEAEPSDDLRHRIAAIERGGLVSAVDVPASSVAPASSDAPAVPPRARGRWVFPVLGAAASLVVGVGLGLGIPALQSMPPTGPPGTLGAVEPIDFSGQPADARVEGDIIAHTWGTESILEIDGVATGDSFSVIVVGSDGQEYQSGTFLGSDVVITCRMNAAVMRNEVASIEVRTAGGETIAAAQVPGVEG